MPRLRTPSFPAPQGAAASLAIAAALFASAFVTAGISGAEDLPSHSVRDGVYTNAQADRGEPLYHEHCERCHGEELDGDEAPALADSEFIADWQGYTLGDVFRRIRIAMPGDHPGLLSPSQCADVLALILRANRFPAGARELEPDMTVLKQIRIEPPAE